jgi:hypothetical protein
VFVTLGVQVTVEVGVDVEVLVYVAVGLLIVTMPPATGNVPCTCPDRCDVSPIDDKSVPTATST